MSELPPKSDMNSRRRIVKNTIGSPVEGYLPPQELDLEEAVLGAVLIEAKHCINDVSAIIVPATFYKDAHARIYNAAITLHKNSHPVDMLTVTKELKRTGELDIVGGAYFITNLTSRVASSANVEYHARIIQEAYIAREVIRMSTESINAAYSSDIDILSVISNIEKQLTDISKSFTVGKTNTMSDLWSEMEQRNKILLEKDGISGVPSGFENIDRITGGWQNPDLIIIAARPAMGKTALAICFARNASVTYGRAGLVFSLEMSALQIATRSFALESNINISTFSRKGVPHEELFQAQMDCAKLIDSEIYIDDTPGITIQELQSKARKLKREKNIEYIIVDYLQLMSGDKSSRTNREQEISGISRGLKLIAKELDIPVIALSQLNRSVETRGGDKRPQLSDLRESGAIEQDADMVIFLHRPEYYGVTEFPEPLDETGSTSTEGVAELIFAKNRNGGVGSEYLKFIPTLTKFTSLVEPRKTVGLSENNNFLCIGKSFYNPINEKDEDPPIPF